MNLTESERDALRVIDTCYRCLTANEIKGLKLMLILYSLLGVIYGRF